MRKTRPISSLSTSTAARWIPRRWRWPTRRETLRIGDVVEQMLESFNKVVMGELREERAVRRLDDDVDVLYTAIKLYLARMPKEDGGRGFTPLGRGD